MIQVRQTNEFADWLDELSDPIAKKRIAARIVRLEAGNFGDVKRLGGKVSELRVDTGPGYRVYFTQSDLEVVILLCGGDKSTQAADIAKARALSKELEEQRAQKKFEQ